MQIISIRGYRSFHVYLALISAEQRTEHVFTAQHEPDLICVQTLIVKGQNKSVSS